MNWGIEGNKDKELILDILDRYKTLIVLLDESNYEEGVNRLNDIHLELQSVVFQYLTSIVSNNRCLKIKKGALCPFYFTFNLPFLILHTLSFLFILKYPQCLQA